MLTRLMSGSVIGVDGYPVDVEVDISTGLPSFNIVGLGDAAVQESKERVRSSIGNCEYPFPLKRITVNLAPAAVRKEGPSFDLAIALGIILAERRESVPCASDYIFIGELALDGLLRPVRGVLPIAIAAQGGAAKGLILPEANAEEASYVEDIEVVPVKSLREAMEFLTGDRSIAPHEPDLRNGPTQSPERDFCEVKGQALAKRALEIAAAGGHNVLMTGSPGSGKTMLARRMPTILPPLEKVEAIEVSKIYSVAGLLPTESPIIFDRPFRSPHHTISAAGLVGGGRVPRPGEISLSHNGVLFLDEFPEFQKHILEVLRQPMESGDVTISRAHSSLTYPARFTLVAAMNPCPCGFHADAAMECVCSPGQIRKYRTRVSGPLLDRLDIHVEVPRLKKEELLETRIGERSETIKERVQAARARQLARFPGVRNATNAGMGAGQARQVCALSGAAMTFLDSALDRLGLSGRVFERVLKVSLTIADLAGADAIEVDHIAEALQYRSFTWGVTV